MTAADIQYTMPLGKKKRAISLQTFLDRYINRDDLYKYEWNNGIVEQKEKTINRDQTKILQRLMRLFTQTKAYKDMGELINEVDMLMKTANRTRRAAIAYMTPQQIEESDNGKLSVCPFVIEVVSKNDQVNELGEKIKEYFDNGVQVLWIIYPKLKKVEVYHSVKDIKVCLENDICSAAPVISDLSISVQSLLQ
jgi:Uma2 family endonuclease